jgi:hypothetical protein
MELKYFPFNEGKTSLAKKLVLGGMKQLMGF